MSGSASETLGTFQPISITLSHASVYVIPLPPTSKSSPSLPYSASSIFSKHLLSPCTPECTARRQPAVAVASLSTLSAHLIRAMLLY